MKIVIIGGTGAMGLIFGARLANGNEVVLLDINKSAIDSVNRDGVKITNKEGNIEIIKNVAATDQAGDAGVADLLIVFTKCYWTGEALENSLACIDQRTTVLTLQNGWGNFDVISKLVNVDQIMIGVNYLSGTIMAPGHVRQAGNPAAFVGRVGRTADQMTKEIASVLCNAGINTTASDSILNEVFKKLALNAATLPTAALLRLEAHKLVENDTVVEIMSDILEEMVRVVTNIGIQIDFAERKAYINNLLKNAIGAKGSMLQDVEAKRQTEIDVINGAIVRMGSKAGIPTPVNRTIVNLIKGLESTFPN